MATEVTALRDALKASRLECNAYQLANEKLLDDKETFLERTQQNADAQVKETEDKFEAELLFVKDEADSKAHALGQELDLLRRAASGDACGWTEAEDGTFSNDETGERSAEVPEVLAFARAVQRIEGVAVQENDLKKALKKAAQAGTKWRELDVKLNEAKADAQADRDVLACWGEAAVAISQAVRAVGARNEALCSRLAAPASSLHTYQQKAKRMADKVQSATASFSRLRRAKCAAEAESKRLSIDVARLEAELVATAAEMASLKGDMNARVDAQVVPMRHAVAEARFAMAQERRLRLAERQTLAGLWPAGPKPACLARHVKREIRHCCTAQRRILRRFPICKSLGQEWVLKQRLCRLRTFCSLEKEAPDEARPWTASPRRRACSTALPASTLGRPTKTESKQAKGQCRWMPGLWTAGAESTKWKEATDDYGRKFYTHHQSGEATWQPPSAMTYEPPPGRDALGNIVAAVEREPEDLCDVSIEAIPADASAVETARREALHAEATWEKVTDDWGQCYWKHKVTSETRWTDPAPAPNPAHSNTVQQLGHSPKNAEHSAEETSAQNSDSSNESPPSAAGGAVYFVRRDERRHARATRRKKAAISAARVVIGYFEELVEERLRRKKAGLLKMDDRDADPPVFGDAQALRELALGARGETWAYVGCSVTRASGRESARVAAGQRHLAAVEAQLLLASRRHEVQRTLAQRRKDTGLGQSLKPRLENKGPLADGPDVQTAMPPLETVEARSSRQFGSAVDVNDSAVEVHDSRVEVHDSRVEVHDSRVEVHDSRVEVHDSRVGIVSPTDHGDPYELLLHGCGNAPSARSIAQLRDDLEAAATAEQDLLTELSERRRRIGALSHKLLMATHKPKFVDPPPAARLLDGTGGSGASRVVQVSALSGPAVAPSPAPDAAAPLGAVRSALSTFAAAQATVFEAPGAVRCGVHDSLGDGVPQLGGEDGGVIHALACAAVYAGLAGEALRAYVIPHQTDLQWAVSTFFDAPEPWGLGPQSARGPLGVREPLDAPTPARSDARRGGPRRRGIAADDAADEALGADFFIPRPPFNGIASLAMLASATSPELGEALSLVRLRGFPPELGVECLGPATRPGFHRAESKPPSEDAVSTSQGEWLPRRVSELLDLGAANALPEQIALLLAGDSKGEGERPPDLPGKPAPRPVAATQRQSAGEDGPGRVRESFREHAVLLRGLLDSAAQAGTRAWNGHVDDQDALVKRLHLLDGLTHSTNKCWEDASRHRAESDAVRRVRATAGDDAQEERQHRRLVRGVARALRAKDRLDEQVCFCKAEFSLEMERCEWLVSGAQRAMAARAGHAAAAAKQTAELLRLQASVAASETFFGAVAVLRFNLVDFAEIRGTARSLLAITSERARAVAGNALGDASAMETVVAAQLALLDVRAQLFRVGVGIRKARWAEAGFWRADVGRLGGDGASRAERRALLDVEASARLDVASLVGMADACEISRDAGDAALGNDAALGSVDARLAAAYARLASIHEARRLARDRERRGRRQGLGACLTAANCAAHDGAPTAFQHSRLPLSLESTRSTRLCVQMLAESARAEVLARRYDARAAVLAIDHVHSLLVEERRTSRRLCAAALEAGHRALRCSKSVTLKISDDFEGYKTARRKDALREARHRDGLEAGLRAGMEHSAAATHLHADVATSLRFGLSLETAKREVGDATNLALQERVARVKSACRLELGVERGHSARLELWVHALVRGSARVAIEVKHMETLLQRQRQLDLSEQNRLNKAVWRERVAAHTLGLDAGQLCFFFASRCCIGSVPPKRERAPRDLGDPEKAPVPTARSQRPRSKTKRRLKIAPRRPFRILSKSTCTILELECSKMWDFIQS
ncbi:hypothetical protein M885DRAFT_499598 [Pelagophyceae sp. CCMP2097]|nr:hypothetical protein M885DRAFT_499598 [Pelagophyceae sp. CCMP2097]